MIKDHLKDKIYTYSKYVNKSLHKLNILTCISGGLDSSVLLHALNELRAKFKFNLDAAHVNYSTHTMSNKMQDQCAKTCKAMQINFFTKLVDGNEIKSNFESNARQIRYSYFNKIDKMNSYDFILTAHHKMDQLETVVMKTVTNSSWVSKIGIREYNEKLRRPLLDISKSCIVAYAENNNIIFKNDPTNTDYSLLRNNIRLVLERYNSSKVENYYINLTRSLKHKFDKLITSLDKSKIIRRNFYIEIDKVFFQSINDEIKKILIQREIKLKFNITITKSRYFWNEVFKLIQNSQSGKKIFLSDDIYISNDRTSFIIAFKKKYLNDGLKIDKDIKWNDYTFKINRNPKKLNHHYGNHSCFIINNDFFEKGIYVRSREKGDKINITKTMSKKVKNIFIDNKISNIEKDLIPIVTDSTNNVIWIPGFASSKFNIRNKESNIVSIKYTL